MIETYGLHWHRTGVFWGRQKVRGTLLGAASRKRNARPVDFRQQRGIYALYSEFELVYVGQTGSGANDRLFHRLRSHKNDHLSERWDKFSWFGTQWVTQVQNRLSAESARLGGEVPHVLNVLEAVCISISEPRLNLSRGRWGDIKQYYQFPDERITNRISDEEEEEEGVGEED